MYGLISILMEVKIREIQKTHSQSFSFASIQAFILARVYFHYSFGVKLTQLKMGLQKLSSKNKRTPERIFFRLKLYGKLQQVQMHLSEKKTSFHCSYVNRCPTHRPLQKQSAATKSKYSARGPEATSINTQVWARNSFN